MKVESKNTTNESEGKISLWGSIKGKVICMGAISIIASLVLGVAGLQSLNKNSVNNEVLTEINNINLLQYKNQSLETSYLYFLDDSYLEQIVGNLREMEANAEAAVKLSSGKQKQEMETVLANITTCRSNYEQLRSLYQSRGFTEDTGAFAEYLANDEALMQDFTTIAEDKHWIDGKWMDPYDGDEVEADGTVYSKMTYANELPKEGKRDYFVARVGGNNIIYDKTIYLTNLIFSGSEGDEIIDFSTIDVESLNGSYGEGLETFEMGEIEGKTALKITCSFTGAEGGWEEIAIKMPAKDYNIQNYDKVSFDLYFEDSYYGGMTVAYGLSDKYGFRDKMTDLNTMVVAYSKNVVEGNDVTEDTTAIVDALDEIVLNLSDYVSNETMKADVMSKMEAKKNAFMKMNEDDKNILQLKQDNISTSNELTQNTGSVRESVEADTIVAKTSLTLIITIILVVIAVVLIVITLAVSRSMNRSVSKFKETLHQVMDGNLMVRADDKGKDEFSVFGKSLNVFLEKLKDIIQSAQNISEEVSESGDGLKEMSVSSSETSGEIERAVDDISKGATSQAEEIEDASGSIADMGTTFEKIVVNVENLNQVTREMRSIAQESTIFMKELATSNEKTAQAFEQVSQQIHITNESVQKIHEAADFITSIASQTNLLSLNASIEAARAGEAGKGFAVVATEIQQLSEQSNTSAKNIEGIISELSAEAIKTVDIVNVVSNVVSEQQDKLLSTQKKFSDLEERVQRAGKETDEIKIFTDDCDKARRKVEEVIGNLSAISEENAASTEETTASMTQLNETIVKLAKEADALNQLAAKLEEDLKFFRLE